MLKRHAAPVLHGWLHSACNGKAYSQARTHACARTHTALHRNMYMITVRLGDDSHTGGPDDDGPGVSTVDHDRRTDDTASHLSAVNALTAQLSASSRQGSVSVAAAAAAAAASGSSFSAGGSSSSSGGGDSSGGSSSGRRATFRRGRLTGTAALLTDADGLPVRIKVHALMFEAGARACTRRYHTKPSFNLLLLVVCNACVFVLHLWFAVQWAVQRLDLVTTAAVLQHRLRVVY
jgi:hypothetical protein